MSLRDRVRDAVTREDDGLTQSQRLYRRELTTAGLARARARGQKLGRPTGVSAEVRARIVAERETKSFGAIAAGLNADAIETAQGGRAWYASTIAAVLDSEADPYGGDAA